jgi:HAD superfamily hydrolase (TIGR01490 family)
MAWIEPRYAAAFSDVEGTLVGANMLALYIRTGERLGYFNRRKKLRAVPAALAARLFPAHSSTYVNLRFAALRALVNGLSLADNQVILQTMMPEIRAAMKAESLSALHGHAAKGLPVILVSAALHLAMQALAAEWGWRGEGTKVVIQDERMTGRPDGKPNTGPAKAERVRQVAQEMQVELRDCIGYGDTSADIPFLSLMGTAIAVDPDTALRQHAERNKWPILTTSA